MAKSLIDSMSSKWNPEKYKDDYREALMEVIEKKWKPVGKRLRRNRRKPQAGEGNRFGFGVTEELWIKPARRKKPRPNRAETKANLPRKQREVDRLLLKTKAKGSRAKAQILGGEAAFFSQRAKDDVFHLVIVQQA